MCMCLARGGVGGEGVSGLGLEQGECVCVLVAVVWVVYVGRVWGECGGMDQGLGGLGVGSYVCMSCESGISVKVQVSVYCAWRIPAYLRCT